MLRSSPGVLSKVFLTEDDSVHSIHLLVGGIQSRFRRTKLWEGECFDTYSTQHRDLIVPYFFEVTTTNMKGRHYPGFP